MMNGGVAPGGIIRTADCDTAVTCAVISVLWIYYPAWRWLYVLAVLAVALGLIGANYHFVSDVIAGGFVGISSGWMLTSLWKAHEHVRRK